MKFLLFIVSIIYTSWCFADVTSLTYYMNGIKIDKYSYSYKGNELKSCNSKGECDVIYNKDRSYCNNLLKLGNKEDADIRMKWECPRYESIHNLKDYKIQLSDDPAFSYYYFNLYKIFSSFEFVKKEHSYYFESINSLVGITPNDIMIPADINDVVENITIEINKDGYIINEIYKLSNKNIIHRKYTYRNMKIVKIADTVSENSKTIYLLENIYSYCK